MLKPASEYAHEVTKILANVHFKDKYKYHIPGWGKPIPRHLQNIWSKHEFVSVDEDDNVIGYIDYWVDHSINTVMAMSIASFTEQATLTFGTDFYQALDDIFCKYKYNKLCFSAVIGCPAEKTYNKLIKRYGGVRVGRDKKQIELIDGKYYTLRKYSILREDYLRCKAATNRR